MKCKDNCGLDVPEGHPDEMKHTPTPWRMEIEDEGFISIFGSRLNQTCGDQVALTPMKKDEDKANAEFILRAVNSHEALLAAAKHMRDTLEHQGMTRILWNEAIAQAEGKK